MFFPTFTFLSIYKALMKRNEGTDLKTYFPDSTAIKLYFIKVTSSRMHWRSANNMVKIFHRHIVLHCREWSETGCCRSKVNISDELVGQKTPMIFFFHLEVKGNLCFFLRLGGLKGSNAAFFIIFFFIFTLL